MKTLLTLIAVLNLSTADTHSINYEPKTIAFGGHEYILEEDYSVSYEFTGRKEFLGMNIEEDFSFNKGVN